MRYSFFVALLWLSSLVFAQKGERIPLETGEKVWSGFVVAGDQTPLPVGYKRDLFGQNNGNQSQPLLLTNRGRYVWSEQPFAYEIGASEIVITSAKGPILTEKKAKTLAEARQLAEKRFFPPSGKMPDPLLFSAPQYNTWIELTYNQNQADVLRYAHKIIENGYPPGVLMIDDTWQEDYGMWNFHPGRFPDPKKMVAELHSLGFKVMVWVCPFISPDQTMILKKFRETGGLIAQKKHADNPAALRSDPAIIEWWNGYSLEIDLTHPAGIAWFEAQLDRLQTEMGIDGFKFDAGDMPFYPDWTTSHLAATPNEHCENYAKLGLKYPLNEFRACWKMAGQPLAQRLCDKFHTWEDLQKLVPSMLAEGLAGYTFSCPDMIGGGEWRSFLDNAELDQELVVRSAQCHALMPMMQFSAAPWRILDEKHHAAVKKSVATRAEFAPLILQLAENSAKTGAPIVSYMEYVFPNAGFENVIDQFMLGDKILVAPMQQKGSRRKVAFPKGRWRADDGQLYEGGKTHEIDVPLERLPFFRLID